jgi:hypothetical protein
MQKNLWKKIQKSKKIKGIFLVLNNIICTRRIIHRSKEGKYGKFKSSSRI